MEILNEVKQILSDAKEFVKSKNFHYEMHRCNEPNGEQIKKVNMDITIKQEDTTKIVKLGYCKDCQTAFYHEDFETKTF